MNKTSNYIRTICEIGMFAAIGFVLDELQGILSKGLFINGGSIGFAMIAVIIIGFRRGWLPAILTGLIMGLFDIATSAYIIHPAQLFLDYILPYALVGLGCLFKIPFDKTNDKKKKIMWLSIATLVGGIAKFFSHYLAGVIFWSDPSGFAWNLTNTNVYLYCFIYNIAFIGPSIIISGAILILMYLRVPSIFSANSIKTEEPQRDNLKIYDYAFNSTLLVGGLFCFVWYLIDYIRSFSIYKENGTIDYSFNPDSMVIFILALFLIVLAVLSFIKIKKGKYSELFGSSVALSIILMSLIYDIRRLIRMYVKGKDPKIYWIWFAVAIVTSLLFVRIVIYFAVKKNKEINESNQQA